MAEHVHIDRLRRVLRGYLDPRAVEQVIKQATEGDECPVSPEVWRRAMEEVGRRGK